MSPYGPHNTEMIMHTWLLRKRLTLKVLFYVNCIFLILEMMQITMLVDLNIDGAIGAFTLTWTLHLMVFFSVL